MKSTIPPRPSRGFSLIEVLVAVVIMSIALLALASLQLSLIRSSADTKAQTVAASLGKQMIEQMLSFQKTGGDDNTCVSPFGNAVNTCYRAIGDVASQSMTIGGVTFDRSAVVGRYVYDKSTLHQGFWLQGSDTALDSTLLTSPVTYLAGKEFKRVDVKVHWIDATGGDRNTYVEDAVAAINPADSAAVSKTTKGATPRKAQAVITNPASVAGVIPIAIGNGSDTAATNPRPIIVSQGQNSTTVETRFDVYTYAALTQTSATAQSRVETAVVGCTCTFGTGTQSAARPTYWNGSEYTVPTTSANIPVSTAKNVTQSDQCTICCRDHQDPSGVAGEKFDPRRTAHNHYLNSNLTAAVTSGDYSEACRLIRVDGVFHVASEPYDDHYGLLATPSIANSTSATVIADMVPGTSVQNLYQTFVINYLRARFVNGTTYNTVVDPIGIAGYPNLQVPVAATIDTLSTPQYLHSRGLLIDYLSTDAIAAITAAKAACASQNVLVPGSCSPATLQTNVLKLLPFTSINATELAKWASTSAARIDIHELTDLSQSIDYAYPASGQTTYITGISPVTGTTTIQGSSAGLAITSKVFPDSEFLNPNDATKTLNAMADTQPFVVGANPAVTGNGTFYVNWVAPNVLGVFPSASNGSGGNNVATTMIFGASAASQPSCGNHAANNTGYFDCSPATTQVTLPASVQIQLSNYNRTAATGKTVPNGCGTSSSTTSMPYELDYDVASYTVNGGSVVSTGITLNGNQYQPGASCANNGGECTSFTVPAVSNNTTIAVTFTGPAYRCPSNWTDYLNTNGTWKSAAANKCQNGAPQNWGSTYVSTCPGGTSTPP